jgi:hypothetical protein
MAVNLSPLGGVAAQFFTNTGAVLTGGKIYTYEAGTSTPAPTYTSLAGSTAHTNPIVLDAAGRVPSGEIWVVNGVSYKFVLKDSTDVLIGTYDNVVSVANDAANVSFIGFEGQNGDVQNLADDDGSNWIGFLPTGTGAVARSAQAKMRDFVSVTDFGADKTGTVDSYPAIQAAINAGQAVYFPTGTYLCHGTPLFDNNNQTIYLQGSTVIFKNYQTLDSYGLRVTGKNVVFEMGGGTFSQAVGYAKIAVNTTPGGTTIQVVDPTTLYPGQTLVSSWGDMLIDPGVYPIGGPTSPPNARRTIAIAGNTVTLSYAMDGTSAYLPADLVVGEWSYGSFCSVYGGGTVTFNDGVWERMIGYYYFTPKTFNVPSVGGETIYFNNMNFASNGLDQFLFAEDQKVYFSYCKVAQQWDVAKSGIWYDHNAFVYIDNSYMELGNFDSSFAITGDRKDLTTGELSVSNSEITGQTKLNPALGASAADSLQAIELRTPGSFRRIVCDNTRFFGYSRHFLSGTVSPFNYSMSCDAVAIDNCLIDGSCSYFICTGVGHGFTIPNFRVSNTSFYQANNYQFFLVAATNSATATCIPYFDNCYLKLNNNEARFDTPAYLSDCRFASTPFTYSYGIVQMDNCSFDASSTIAISPTYSESFYGSLQRITIEDTDFPTNPAAVFTALGGSSLSGAKLASAKSVNGSTYYDVYKIGSNIAVSGLFNTANGTYFLRGSDYYIPVGSTIKDMYQGTISKVTFNLLTTLSNAAVAADTSIQVTSAASIAVGDKINVLCNDGLVKTVVVDAAYVSGTTIPLTTAFGNTAAAGNAVNFFRVV